MNKRIRELRKSLGLTLENFGERIGIKKSSLSTIENGKSNASEQTILSICREFNVNEEWLRTGEGPMYKESDTFSLDEYNVKERLIGAITVMSDDEANKLWNYVKSFHEGVLL